MDTSVYIVGHKQNNVYNIASGLVKQNSEPAETSEQNMRIYASYFNPNGSHLRLLVALVPNQLPQPTRWSSLSLLPYLSWRLHKCCHPNVIYILQVLRQNCLAENKMTNFEVFITGAAHTLQDINYDMY